MTFPLLHPEYQHNRGGLGPWDFFLPRDATPRALRAGKRYARELRLQAAIEDAAVRMLYGNRGHACCVLVEHIGGVTAVILLDLDRAVIPDVLVGKLEPQTIVHWYMDR